MNFIKGIYNKVSGQPQTLVEQEIFDFFILGTIYKKDEDKFTKMSSNTEFVFDKLNNDQFDHILIVRLHRASKQYNNTVSQREGDLYFNISFFKQIYQSSLSEEIEEFCIDLTDSTNVDWSIRQQFLKTAKSDINKIQKFKQFLSKLIWLWNNKKVLPKNEGEFAKLIPAKPASKLEMKELVQQNKTKKVLKKVDRSILTKQIFRNRQEKEMIGDALNYFLQHDADTIQQIYAGQLFVLYPETAEILQINQIVIMALNILSKTECRMELYNKDRQLLLIQPLKDFISFEVDQQNNYLSWVYFDGYNSIVLYLKFDVIDGATSMALILQRARINMKAKQQLELESSTSLSQISTATTIEIPQQKQLQTYFFNDQFTVIAEYKNNTQNSIFLLFSNLEEKIILQDRNIYFYQNNQLKSKQTFQLKFSFDRCCLSQNKQILVLYQQFTKELYALELKTQKLRQIEIPTSIVDVSAMENLFVLITPKQVFSVDEKFSLSQIYKTQDKNENVFQIVRCTNQHAVIIGTYFGQTLVFDGIKSMKLLNEFEGLGDPILDIQIQDNGEYIIINNGSYLQYQQIITKLQDGYKQHLDLKPFPIRISLNPEDLILMGIFSEPIFRYVKVDNSGSLIIAELETIQIVWNVAQILRNQANSYQVYLLSEEIYDQHFSGQNLVFVTACKLMERLQKL